MNYSTGQQIKVGDEVVADGISGIVVCDFDNREFLVGYADWDFPTVEMLGGGTLSSGVMIRTGEAGLIHYEEDADIVFVRFRRDTINRRKPNNVRFPPLTDLSLATGYYRAIESGIEMSGTLKRQRP
ncbi:hypothetical protein [Mesorhizobium muleiense]|uniref:hypothetical protein n=1 Tax=Mesorhizobium muleiense TaxID=1004279 RepID=UPI001F453F12|nr:hypothetical protein [Mesorhizobium muleiense]MCF6113513.1 hypothetical protein [Mesorhizobium muleiense]